VKQRLTDLRFELRDALPERRRRQRDGARRGSSEGAQPLRNIEAIRKMEATPTRS